MFFLVDQPTDEDGRGVCPELAVVRESHHPLVWQRLRAGRGAGGLPGGVQGSGDGGCGPGAARGALTRRGIPRDRLGERVWLSLVGPELEEGTELGEAAVSY